MGGHSLGGIVLETYIKDNPELAEAIVASTIFSSPVFHLEWHQVKFEKK